MFITAYTQYHISQKKLGLLRGQERSIKHQRKELESKNLTLNKVQSFVDQAHKLGLKKKEWDLFYVNLKEDGVSFSKLETILSQTANSSHYFFKPVSLEIRTGSQRTNRQQNDSENTSQGSKTANQPSNQISPLTTNSIDLQSSDAVITVEGHFLVNRRGGK